jgi:hypothetical protein
MGVWFLSNAAGNKLAGSIGALAEGHGDATVFGGIAVGSAVAGVILFVLGPRLHRMTHGAEDDLAQPFLMPAAARSSKGSRRVRRCLAPSEAPPSSLALVRAQAVWMGEPDGQTAAYA